MLNQTSGKIDTGNLISAGDQFFRYVPRPAAKVENASSWRNSREEKTIKRWHGGRQIPIQPKFVVHVGDIVVRRFVWH
jgi:hypothetical protein